MVLGQRLLSLPLNEQRECHLVVESTRVNLLECQCPLNSASASSSARVVAPDHRGGLWHHPESRRERIGSTPGIRCTASFSGANGVALAQGISPSTRFAHFAIHQTSPRPVRSRYGARAFATGTPPVLRRPACAAAAPSASCLTRPTPAGSPATARGCPGVAATGRTGTARAPDAGRQRSRLWLTNSTCSRRSFTSLGARTSAGSPR